MRRLKGFVVMIVIFCAPLSGQSFSDFGVKGGINYTRISETGTLPGVTKFVNRFVVGVYADFEVVPYLFIRYELLYSNKGTTREITSADQEFTMNDAVWLFTIKRKLSYLDPSITAHYPLRITDQTRVLFFAGASLSLNIRAQSFVEGIYEGIPYVNSLSNGNSFLPIDPGLILGAGIEYDLHKLNISVDVRYKHGLMNIWDRGAASVPDVIADEAGLYGVPKMHNRTLSLMIGIGL